MSVKGWWIVFCISSVLPASLSAQERRNAGLVVPIPTTITTEAKSRLSSALYAPLRRYEDDRNRDPKGTGNFYLLCDFNPDNRANASDDPGACQTLARYLRDVQRKQGIQVIAFVHGKVTRHAVLPVLACSEILMSKTPPAYLGKVADAQHPLENLARLAYEDIADIANKRYPSVLIRKMYDARVEVVKGRDGLPHDGAPPFPPQLGRGRGGRGEPMPGLGRGDTSGYSFEQASQFGLCQPTECNDIDTALRIYQLPRDSLYPALDRIVAWRIVLKGAVNGEMKERAERRIRQALGEKANVLILELACGGGESRAAYDLAFFLAELNDNRRDPVETIAYVTGRASDTAAFLAFACNKIVMQREIKKNGQQVQEAAILGGFDRYILAHPEREATMRRNLGDIAEKKHYPRILAEGMLDRDLRIYAVKSTKEESVRKFMSKAELDADQQGEQRWQSVGVIKPPGGKEESNYLTLTADQARELGLARDAVNNFEELCELEGINTGEVRTVDSDFLDALVDFLRDPWTSVVLVMVGITCLILELKMPGVGLPGIVSAVCFLLFFWSQSQVSGQIVWLAFLLFLLGLFLLVLEIFFIPGFGVTGVSGIILVLGSIGLAAYGRLPRSNEEWLAYGQALGPFTISMVGAIVSAFVLARYLPYIPYANRLMLKPQDEEGEFGEEPSSTIRPELAALLGAIGVAATPLRPAGKVQFGDDFVDVVAEGSYVLPGTRVQVVEIEGNRVVVKEV